MEFYTAEFPSDQFPIKGETGYRLRRSGRSHILNWSEFLKFLDFRSGVGEVSFICNTEHTWLDYYRKLWTQQFKDNTTERKLEQLAENCFDIITMEELETTIKTLKPRKSPGSDGINNELYKHAPKSFLHKFFKCLLDLWGHSRGMEDSYCYTNTQKRRQK